MLRSAHFLGSLFLGLSLSACALIGQGKGQKCQEAALETNMNARFGRLEVAVEHVDPKARDSFMDRRRTWGTSIRIADYDMVGMKITGENEAETVMRVAWYRFAENELRSTSIKQKWHSGKDGEWSLTDEARLDGDSGLIGDVVPAYVRETAAAEAAVAAKRSQFPTVTLGTTQGSTIGGGNIGVMDLPPASIPKPIQQDPAAEGKGMVGQ